MKTRGFFRSISESVFISRPAFRSSYSIVLLLYLISIISGCSSSDNSLYLGQVTPGMNVEVFAPGIVSTDQYKEFNCTISPDGTEFYFTRVDPSTMKFRIMCCSVTDGVLSLPQSPGFAFDCNETSPSLSIDGKRLYYASMRPRPGGTAVSGNFNNWRVTRGADGWGEAELLNPPVSLYLPVYMSFAKSGTLYFEGLAQSGIMYSEFANEVYTQPRNLPEEINYLKNVAHPAIAPDESYIIVDAYDEKNELSYLYISFRKSDGSWTKAVSLRSTIKAADSDVHAIPKLTPDGKYLFFERYEDPFESDICWISTEVLKGLASTQLNK